MHVRVYVCMYVCVYICMYVFTYIYIYLCVCVRMYVCMYVCKDKGKGTSVPLQAWTGPEGSRKLRLPDFMTVGT